MVIHVVKPGESVYSIAQAYGITARNIISNNGLKNPDRLVPGQAIIILVPDTVHEVEPGETIYSISRYYNITTSELLRNNPFLEGRYIIIPGQKLVISYYTDKNGQILVVGLAYSDIDENVLRKTAPYLTYVTVFAYSFTEDGCLIPLNDENIINLSRELRLPLTMNVSAVNPDGSQSSELAGKILKNPAAQNALLNDIASTMKQKGYNSLNIDFEQVTRDDRFAFGEFIEYLAEGLNQYVYPVIVQVAPKTSKEQEGIFFEGQDYEKLGQVSNAVVLMPREEIRRQGQPGAIIPADEMEAAVKYAVTVIPAEKLFIGIPNYALDWTLPYITGVTAEKLTNDEALQLAADKNADIQFDEKAQAPFFVYRDENGLRHEVWFQDARSIEALARLVAKYKLRGISVWTIMDYYQPIWTVINDMFEISKIPL